MYAPLRRAAPGPWRMRVHRSGRAGTCSLRATTQSSDSWWTIWPAETVSIGWVV
nr:MAG TPA: hypothetical protein [Caudoviricetes sp.]